MNQVFKIKKEDLENYLDSEKTYHEIARIYKCSIWTIMAKVKLYNLSNKVKGKSSSKIGDKNPAKRQDVRDRISETVKLQYKIHREKNIPYGFGYGKDNYISDKLREKHPNWKGGISQEKKIDDQCFKEYGEKCFICRTIKKEKKNSLEHSNIYIHHLNYIYNDHRIENIIPVCNSCHQKLHRWWKGWILMVQTDIDYAHHIPDYKGKCFYFHGHTAIIKLGVQGLIREDGMVIDFKQLKEMLKKITDPLDHVYLNYLENNPTTEKLITFIFHQVELELYKIRLKDKRIVWLKNLEISEGLNKSIILDYK